MRIMTGALVLALALVVCGREPERKAEGKPLAAGLTSSAASAGEAEQDSSPMVVRRLWFYSDGLDFWGGPSPDGRYVTFVDWKTEDLAVHGEGDRWPQVVEWSHDGRNIYYVLWGYPEDDPSRGLWRVPADGGEPEQLDWYMEFDVKQIPVSTLTVDKSGSRSVSSAPKFGSWRISSRRKLWGNRNQGRSRRVP